MSANAAPEVSEVVTTKRHEAPRYVTAVPGGTPKIEPAPIINHTDVELTLLEALVGRQPPFGASEGSDGDMGAGTGTPSVLAPQEAHSATSGALVQPPQGGDGALEQAPWDRWIGHQ